LGNVEHTYLHFEIGPGLSFSLMSRGGADAGVAGEHTLAELAIGGPGAGLLALRLPPPSYSMRYRRRANQWQLPIPIYILDESWFSVYSSVFTVTSFLRALQICPLLRLRSWLLDI
jgi:hypothetical protein